MDLIYSLIIYFIVLIVLCLGLIRNGIRTWSSIILSLLITQIALNLLCPPSTLDLWGENSNEDPGSGPAIYLVIQLVSPLIIILYVILMAWNDHDLPSKPGYTS
jgi:hypothetical protein